MCLCIMIEEVRIQSLVYVGVYSAVQRGLGSKCVAYPTENVHLFLREMRMKLKTTEPSEK